MTLKDYFSHMSWKARVCIVSVLITPIFLPAALPALVFGVLAYRELREHSSEINRHPLVLGWRVAVILLIAIPLLIAALITIPNLFRGEQVQNEATAVSNFRLCKSALSNFARTNGGYPGSISQLVEAGLMPPEYAATERSGYKYVYEALRPVLLPSQNKHVFSAFSLAATPACFRCGKRAFYLDESGQILVRESAKPDARIEEIIR